MVFKYLLIIVSQTFGGLLNFNCHLHMLLSAGGFQESECLWIEWLHFDKAELMRMWRLALCSYLWVASRLGAIRSNLSSEEFEEILQVQARLDHLCRPLYVEEEVPVLRGTIRSTATAAQNHIVEITETDIRFLAKKRKNNCVRVVTLQWSKQKLVDTLGHHVPDRYRHAMRYFGLLAPLSKRDISDTLLAMLRQKKPPRQDRLSWPELSLRTFDINPLMDSRRQVMHWVG
jgi:hypothetical protein